MIIGITGGIGSGKTTVSGFFEQLGGYILNADSINHSLMKTGKLSYNEIVSAFGKTIVSKNGEIDRQKLGEIVFKDKEKLEILERITHKNVISFIKNIILNDDLTNEFIVIEAIKLVETEIVDFCDFIIIVEADELIRANRVEKRNNITFDDAIIRIRNQKNNEDFRKFSNLVITNNDSVEQLKRQVVEMYNHIFSNGVEA